MNTEKLSRTLYTETAARGIVPVLDEWFCYPLRVELGYSSSLCGQPVDELDLSARAQHCLMRAGITTVGQLLAVAGTDELLKLRNLGRKSYVEIRTKLLAYGYGYLSEQRKLAFWDAFLPVNVLKPRDS